jgi:hypothetical protein
LGTIIKKNQLKTNSTIGIINLLLTSLDSNESEGQKTKRLEEKEKTLSKGVWVVWVKAKGLEMPLLSTRIIQQSDHEQRQRWSIIPSFTLRAWSGVSSGFNCR